MVQAITLARPAIRMAPPRIDPALPPLRVNLYSDTQTKPSAAMKAAMMAAEVGDEQHGDDPAILELCDRMAALLGKEAAVFLPSGTMCNQISILTHCRPGDEILAHELSHIIANEGGGPGAADRCGGVGPEGGARPVRPRHRPAPRSREPRRNAPPQTLLEVEQTANAGGGSVWPLDKLNAVMDAAHEAGMPHPHGRRAADERRRSPRACRRAKWSRNAILRLVGLHQGPGRAVGAVLCGSDAFIDDAWRWKQRLGGSLRQGGICAAACTYALDHNIDRLAEDHANARILARGLAQVPGLAVEEPETNLVFFDTSAAGLTADELADRIRTEGVQVSTVGKYRVRACTHLDVDRAGVELAIQVIREKISA